MPEQIDIIDINEISREFDDFEESMFYIVGVEDRKRRLDFIKKIQAAINKFPDSSKLYFILGECLYNLSSWEEEDKLLIESSFHRSDLLDNTVLISKIYLTFFYYDIGEYYLCMKIFAQIDSQKLDNERSRWRLIKITELNICCQIIINKANQLDLENQILEFIKLIDRNDPRDLMTIEPNNLFKVLKNKPVLSFENIKLVKQLKLKFKE